VIRLICATGLAWRAEQAPDVLPLLRMKNYPCLNCRTDNPSTANFCHHCGQAMESVARPFQSSAWPDLGTIESAFAKMSSSPSVQAVDTIGVDFTQAQARAPEPWTPPVDPIAALASRLATPQSGSEWSARVPNQSDPPNKPWSPQVGNAESTRQSPALQWPNEAAGQVGQTAFRPDLDKRHADARVADSRPDVELTLNFGRRTNQTNVESPAAFPQTGKWLGLFCSAVLVVALGAWWMSGSSPSSAAESIPVVAKPVPLVIAPESNVDGQLSSAGFPTPAFAAQVEVHDMQPKNTVAATVNKKTNGREKSPVSATASAVGPALSSTPASVTGDPTQAPVATPNTVASPQDACSNLGVFSRNSCLAQQCANAAYIQHAHCQRWRAQQQEQEQQRLYGGS
jgi:hypothetical protein